MSKNNILENIKKLRELTGVGFKDCKLAIDENNGDIDKSIEFLRKKGIAKASKKMDRVANEGLILVHSENNEISLIEINSETDFVAKNKDFINFCKELSLYNFKSKGNLTKLENTMMLNKNSVKDNLINLIAKIGEKITIRRAKFFDKKGINFFYVHSAVEKNIGKIVSVVQIEGSKENEIKDVGNKIAMHVAASNPIAIEKNGIEKDILDKEMEIIKEELKNSGKNEEMINKIALGKLNKFISDNTLLNQIWIMDPKKKVSDVIRENSNGKNLKIIDFARFKVGEGV